jgi:hypothetical protein
MPMPDQQAAQHNKQHAASVLELSHNESETCSQYVSSNENDPDTHQAMSEMSAVSQSQCSEITALVL